MIKHILLDPNGLCNAKCWFCPVAYVGNPLIGKTNMSIETMDNILKQIKDGIGDFISDDVKIWPFHYNEVLLYPHLEDMLKLHRKYNLKMAIFSNGVNLTPEKIDLLSNYSDVIFHMVLNIPSAFPEEWSSLTGFNIKLFDKLINNLNYAVNKKNFLPKSAVIQVNGVNNNSLSKNGGYVTLLSNSPKINLDVLNGDNARSIKKLKTLFPQFTILQELEILDRTTYLENLKILSNQEYIKSKNGKNVVGCLDKRDTEWIHISANGDFFLCCQDFDYKTIFTNIKEKSIKDVWFGEERREIIKKSFSNFCQTCTFAIWD
jgi:MoaA/NifB/PqqE/SkfB family radical SAM enzyme